jgi:hypothetical protein
MEHLWRWVAPISLVLEPEQLYGCGIAADTSLVKNVGYTATRKELVKPVGFFRKTDWVY